MRRVIAALACFSFSGFGLADSSSAPPSVVKATIDRGLAFLAKDALTWKKQHNCVSCHHAGLVIWSMWEAKQQGHTVDEQILGELTKWVAGSGDGKTSVPRPANIPKALNEKAVLFALALGANPSPDPVSRNGIKRLLTTVKGDQLENGSWASWPETRPPIFGNSDDCTTALATLALLPAAATGDESAKLARDNGVRWLADTKSDNDPQSLALRLVLWQRLGRPSAEWEPLAMRIKTRQKPNGGSSQTDSMTSDAWAAGQALYALAHTGIKSDNPVISKAHAFLIKTQREDGSWPMTSRPIKPGGEGSKSLIPSTGAGASWAVMGLARSQ